MKSKHWRHFSNIECGVQKINYSRNFERKERKFQKYLRLYREKKKKEHRNGHAETDK